MYHEIWPEADKGWLRQAGAHFCINKGHVPYAPHLKSVAYLIINMHYSNYNFITHLSNYEKIVK